MVNHKEPPVRDQKRSEVIGDEVLSTAHTAVRSV